MRVFEADVAANAFLLGEHSVVYGYPALVTSVDMRTKCSLHGREDDRVTVNSAGYGTINQRIREITSRDYSIEDLKKDEMNLTRLLIKTVEEEFGLPSGFDMEVDTQIPKTCKGLSRSGSILCSAFNVLTSFCGVPVKKEDYFKYLLPLQEVMHGGKASGAELHSHVYGGVHKVKKDGTREKIANPGFDIVIGDTGVESKTSETVEYVRRGWERDEKSFERVFQKIGNIVEKGVIALKSSDAKKLGKLMNEDHEILARGLGVSHPKLNELVDVSREAGAFGAKLTGSGRGGAMIALVDELHKEIVANAIRRVGGKPYITKMGTQELFEKVTE